MILIFQKNFYKLFNREIFHIHFVPLQFFIYHFCCYIIFTRYRIIRIQTKVLLIDLSNLYFRCIQSKKYPHPKLDYNNFILAVRRKQIYHHENKIGRVFDFRTDGHKDHEEIERKSCPRSIRASAFLKVTKESERSAAVIDEKRGKIKRESGGRM